MRRSILLVFSLLAFVVSAYAQFKFTSIDFPGGTLTTARGINNRGEIVGSYAIVPPRHALLIRAGHFIPLAPTTVLGTNTSEAFKSNDRGDVVGQYIGDDGFFHGFLLRKSKRVLTTLDPGVLTTLDFPGASDTYAFGINDSGTVVGYWDLLDAGGNVLANHGFTWKDGSFSEVNFPGSGDTSILGISARGDLVGAWDSGITSPIAHGFVCSKKQCSSFDVPVPGATLTQADDINANGQIVGAYIDANGVLHAFLLAGANFTSIDFPGAASTLAWGINSAGQVVGDYLNADGTTHGFLAQPANKGKP
jgi:probable HAF family extracellular repeat protein